MPLPWDPASGEPGPAKEPSAALAFSCGQPTKEKSVMPSTTVAHGTFPSRKAADQAIHRLIASGFARNSIDLDRHEDDEGYDLTVHTREENLSRVEDLMYQSATAFTLQRAASGTLRAVKSNPILILGAGLLAGLAIYSLLPGHEEPARRSRHARRR
jgi:hypothetical protein